MQGIELETTTGINDGLRKGSHLHQSLHETIEQCTEGIPQFLGLKNSQSSKLKLSRKLKPARKSSR
jgi:hypothetical protein